MWSKTETASVSVRLHPTESGTSRITIIWPDNAIEKQWLQVTVKVTDRTGLAEPDVFYWGNAIGESGLGNTSLFALVNGYDAIAPRYNPHTLDDPAGIDDFVDYNRDKLVDWSDMMCVVHNATNITTALRLITLPPSDAGAGIAASVLPETSLDASVLVRVNQGGKSLIAPVPAPAPALAHDSPGSTSRVRNGGASAAVLAAHDAVLKDRAAPQSAISDATAVDEAAGLEDLDPTSADTRDPENDDSAVDEVLATDWLYE